MKQYTKHQIRRNDWRPDAPDFRDHYTGEQFKLSVPKRLPSSVDMSAQCPPVYDQGDLGSCTGNGIAGIVQFDRIKQGLPNWTPSRLAIYYNERLLEHTTRQDSGANIRDGIKTIAKQGTADESLWPYDVAKFTRRPSKSFYTEAAKHPGIQYARVDQTEKAIKTALAAGFPIVFGFTAYESFMSAQVAKTGIVPMPRATEKPVGGHCMVLIGYSQNLIFRNSWGKSWGNRGNGEIPFQYLTDSDYASDLWVVKGTE